MDKNKSLAIVLIGDNNHGKSKTLKELSGTESCNWFQYKIVENSELWVHYYKFQRSLEEYSEFNEQIPEDQFWLQFKALLERQWKNSTNEGKLYYPPVLVCACHLKQSPKWIKCLKEKYNKVIPILCPDGKNDKEYQELIDERVNEIKEHLKEYAQKLLKEC